MRQHLRGGLNIPQFYDEHRIHKASTRNEYEYEYEYERASKNVEYECTDVHNQNSSGSRYLT